jgi:pimeloyl-ACP methyl ester carboxylesterase
MERAQVNGVELEYEIRGSGEPVLLIDMIVADCFVPLFSEPALADRYQFIRYHKRGWVGSTHTLPPVSIADHAEDAAALLEHLGFGLTHVVGQSSGGAIALQLALDRPEMVHTLVLLEPTILSVPSAHILLQKAGPAFDAYAAGDHETALSIFMSVVTLLDWNMCKTVLDARIPGAVAQVIKDADTFFGIEVPSLTEWAFGAEQAAAINQPVLSVRGTETDPLWVEVAALLRSQLPNVEDCEIEGVGHLLHIQRPEPVAQATTRFLGDHAISAG